MEPNVRRTHSAIRYLDKTAVPALRELARAKRSTISEAVFAGRRDVSNFNTNY
jgi:hypothetical protein